MHRDALGLTATTASQVGPISIRLSALARWELTRRCPVSSPGGDEADGAAAVDAQSPLTASELQVLRSQFDSESAKGWVSVQTKFNLAWGCVKSDDKVEVAEGVSILMGPSTSPPAAASRLTSRNLPH